ncbi:bromo adjacent homology domain-containing 1 protein [Chanos chanos]|uniref:Bromo adjacent homology domain-containing 1 protein n=1 Tax=Chanos chanos TaxID=29144 RepID=A0A6J2V867_CHACN|nr:bromo adjacent homology domain-containing 1 protein-like [Chanos chanos]
MTHIATVSAYVLNNALGKNVMTRTWQKDSLSQCWGEGLDHSVGWSHFDTMRRTCPDYNGRGGRAKSGVAKKGRAKVSKKLRADRDRKLYPLRGRGGTPETEPLSCHVLLKRLEEDVLDQNNSLHDHGQNQVSGKRKQAKCMSARKRIDKAIKSDHIPSKTKLKPTTEKPQAQEPRKRRLASLNAEAVNSLLLEKADSPPSAKLNRKQQQEAALGGQSDINSEQTRNGPSKKASLIELCQSSKQTKKTKSEDKVHHELNLDAPTPRRLAGLNAVALLKLTSSTAGTKQRAKMDSKITCAIGRKVAASKSKSRQSKKKGWKQPPTQGGCAVCKRHGCFEPKLKWEEAVGSHPLTKPSYQSRSMLGYPLKVVKEEQVETELSSYYCCPPEGSMEYCLAHPTLTLSTHPCLCADPCFSSYYVHITHPGPPSASLSAQPLPYTPAHLCPGRVSAGTKLLAPSVSHASGISHSAFCNSVRSPCYSDACRVSGYTFSAIQPVTSRGCSFPTGCSNCTHPIKTEGYSLQQGEHSPSLGAPPALPLSGCPLPRVAPSTTPAPQLLQAKVRLQVGTECPQNTKPSNGSLAMGRIRLSQKQPAPSPASTKQRRASRRQDTNGWLPVGVPTEREIFIAGEDETALRQCYEGVERDGEVIRVRDTVLLRSGPRKKSLPYVAKISALWEDPKTGELMMSLFWYYRPEHTQGGRDPSMHCENEIFASRHQDENSVACIEDRCYVLPLAQYCRFCALVKRRAESVPNSPPVVPCPVDYTTPSHRLVPDDVDPELVYLCRHVYDFRYGRILKNLQ